MTTNLVFLLYHLGVSMSLVLPDAARSFTYPLEYRSFAKQGEGADGFITGIVTEKELPR